MATNEELDARLAALEQLIATPRAAVPPITVGELVDVPAPGSPIASAWAQEVSNRILHRFANKAAVDGWAAAAGSIAVAADTGLIYQRFGGSWQPVKVGVETFSIPSTNANIVATSTEVGRVNIPAAPYRRLVGVTVMGLVGFPFDAANQYQLTLTHVNAGVVSIRAPGGSSMSIPLVTATLAAATAAVVKVDSIRTQGAAASTALVGWIGQVITWPIP